MRWWKQLSLSTDTSIQAFFELLNLFLLNTSQDKSRFKIFMLSLTSNILFTDISPHKYHQYGLNGIFITQEVMKKRNDIWSVWSYQIFYFNVKYKSKHKKHFTSCINSYIGKFNDSNFIHSIINHNLLLRILFFLHSIQIQKLFSTYVNFLYYWTIH